MFTVCFPLRLEKVKNGATFLEAKTMVIGRDAAEFWSHLNFLIIYYRRRDLTLGVFFRNNHASKMRIFEIVYIDLHFQGHLLQELGYQHSLIILVKTW